MYNPEFITEQSYLTPVIPHVLSSQWLAQGISTTLGDLINLADGTQH